MVLESRKGRPAAAGWKTGLTARQGFVDVGLVAHIEHQPVLRRIEYPVDGYRQFHHAHIGGEVTAGFRHIFQQKLPQLTAELRQLFLIECPDVRRGMNGIQNHNDLQCRSGAMKQMQKPARQIHHLLALVHGKGLSNGFSADG